MPTVVISANTGADYSGVDNARLQEGAPFSNDSTSATMSIRLQGGNSRWMLVRFTGLSNITGPVTVSSATFSLYDTTALNPTVDIYRVRRNWVTGQVTWNEWKTSNSWATAGARGTGDSDASAMVSITQSGTASYQNWTGSTLAACVEDWINTPTDATNGNWGLIVVPTSDAGSIVYEASAGTDGNRPKLSVTYSAAAGTSVAWITA